MIDNILDKINANLPPPIRILGLTLKFIIYIFPVQWQKSVLYLYYFYTITVFINCLKQLFLYILRFKFGLFSFFTNIIYIYLDFTCLFQFWF